MRIKYWCKTGLQILGAALGGAALYLVIMMLQMDDFADGVQMLPAFLMQMGAIMVMAMMIGIFKLNVPLALSFGSTRQEILVGLQIARLLPAVCLTALLVGLTALIQEADFIAPVDMLPLSLGLYLATGAVGTLSGIAALRWGKIAAVLTVILIMVLAFGLGMMVSIGTPVYLFDLHKVSWLILGVGVIVYGIAMIPEHRTVWSYNVKL